jgi:hypothetical protein
MESLWAATLDRNEGQEAGGQAVVATARQCYRQFAAIKFFEDQAASGREPAYKVLVRTYTATWPLSVLCQGDNGYELNQTACHQRNIAHFE